jgi:hypothetical protein
MKRDNIVSALVGVLAGAALVSLMGAGQPTNSPTATTCAAGAPVGGFVVVVGAEGYAQVINEKGQSTRVARTKDNGEQMFPHLNRTPSGTPGK